MLSVERDGLRVEIECDLRNLALRIAEAQAALSAGDRLNAHLVTQYAMITESIARYNQIRSIWPLIEGES